MTYLRIHQFTFNVIMLWAGIQQMNLFRLNKWAGCIEVFQLITYIAKLGIGFMGTLQFIMRFLGMKHGILRLNLIMTL